MFTFQIGIFLLIGNVSGQLGIFSANWEKIWYRKPDPVLYREKALIGKNRKMSINGKKLARNEQMDMIFMYMKIFWA